MSNNEKIFDMLSEVESMLYYAWSQSIESEELKEAHTHAREALVAFAKATGCHN